MPSCVGCSNEALHVMRSASSSQREGRSSEFGMTATKVARSASHSVLRSPEQMRRAELHRASADLARCTGA
jgi:hypothetical protein